MQGSTLSASNALALPSPWWQRLRQAGHDYVRLALAAWNERRQFERERRELSAVAGLGPRMLRDIGAAGWLQNERREEREIVSRQLGPQNARIWTG